MDEATYGDTITYAQFGRILYLLGVAKQDKYKII